MIERTKSYELWLTELLDARFAAYAEAASPRLLDELYVLVGTLKIVGFEKMYESNRRRLIESRGVDAERRESVPDAAPEPTATPAVSRPISDIAESLRGRIIGQEGAVNHVVDRLSIARAGLKLRRDRPDAVFLFAGPTGVGKTELARQLAISAEGSPEALIRLDMSEFSSRVATSKLIGPEPGYAGYNDPEGWLTTRVRRAPRSVVLLDEIEKAHPVVWNIFLQVFDAGRLTDGQGKVADFSQTVIVMTSNLGVREAGRLVPGFGTSKPDPRTRQLAAIAEAMPPELLNRIDDVIVFEPLGLDAIERIAMAELVAFSERLAANDWSIEIGEGVPRWLAENGHDPAFGVRHLHRVLERDVLVRLAGAGSRRVRLEVAGGELAVIVL